MNAVTEVMDELRKALSELEDCRARNADLRTMLEQTARALNHAEEAMVRLETQRDEARAALATCPDCVMYAKRSSRFAEQADQLQRERDEARAEVERLRAEAAPMNEHFNAGYRDGARDAFKRGAEVMREACARWVDHWVSGHVADKLRDLPIPEDK